MSLNEKERLILSIKHQNNQIRHLQKIMETPVSEKERHVLRILESMCDNMPKIESLTWKYFELGYDDVSDKIKTAKKQRNMTQCRCGHAKSRHNSSGCIDCSCSTFIDPDSWQ